MSNALAKSIALAVLLLGCVTSVYADVYGSISGVIKDRSGAVLPGVTIKATAPVLPKGRDTVTEADGAYSFMKLPPATYTVTASLAGMGSVRATALVQVDKDTTVNLTLNPSVSESITVSGAAPSVDMKKTEVNTNYDEKTIERLPLPRTYQGLFQLAPGIADNNSFAPVAGGGRQENYFLLDGVSVTNPLFGYPSLLTSDANELDI
ncbi:MAG TPA: carboxypeptidase-like regulatory domain-containing protein, partial [Thermoanaerobaculia bacterium]|nr:carboxypeptidase-like regulatory domain-containing protein [Thermoanaerobaculia bacterium]